MQAKQPLSLSHGMILALAYLVAGKLGLMLALPPGFASPVFPAVGIAVAATLVFGIRSWPWIFLGSLLLNLWIGYEASPHFNSLGLLIASVIAIASLLQAAAGGYLLSKVLSQPVSLDSGQDLFRFFVLAPLICLISASLSVSSLYLLGIVAGEQFTVNWASWWIGDTLGLVLFLPITMTLIGVPRSLWRSRVRSTALPLMLIFLLFVGVFVKASEWENQASLTEFNQLSLRLNAQLHSKLDEQAALLEQMSQLFILSNERTIALEKFQLFVSPTLQRYPMVQAFEWAPYVPQSQRAAFEHYHAFTQPDFALREKHTDGSIQLANQRQFYYPVTYVVPLVGNQKALGFDLASNPERLAAIETAKKIPSGIVATAGIKLVQEQQQQLGILLIRAVNTGQNTSDIVLTVLRMGDFMQKLVPDINQQLHSRLIDLESQQTLFDDFADKVEPLNRYQFEFGTRQYRLETAPTAVYMQKHRGWQSWSVLVAGVIGAALLGALLILASGYRVRLEMQVKTRTQELADSQAYTQAILNNVLDGIITVNQQGRVIHSNQAAQQLLWANQATPADSYLYQILAEPFRHDYQQAFIQGQNALAPLLGETKELFGINGKGTRFPMELSLSKMQQNGQIFFNAMVRDITERARVDQMKSEFISTVSHELRTPLTAIRGSLALLTSGTLGNLNQTAQSMMDIALRNSERLILLVNDILDCEKIKAGKMEFNTRAVNVEPLLSHLIENHHGYAAQYKVNIKLDLNSTNATWIYVDENRLIQVLSNLLSNAIKFSPSEGQVELSLSTLNQRVRISITDHGPGISDDFKQRIFQQFAQSDSSDTRAKGGTGLGLNISKAITEHMGGIIGFESIPNISTTFFVEFEQYQPSIH